MPKEYSLQVFRERTPIITMILFDGLSFRYPISLHRSVELKAGMLPARSFFDDLNIFDLID